MPVGVHYSHHNVKELFLVVGAQFREDTCKMLHGEVLKQPKHAGLLLLLHPSPLEGLELKFVELGHESEASALVEEVKFLVVFVKGSSSRRRLLRRSLLLLIEMLELLFLSRSIQYVSIFFLITIKYLNISLSILLDFDFSVRKYCLGGSYT